MDAQMLQRNMGVKRAPERWQDNRDVFDAVVTFDDRIMEQLLDGEAIASAAYTLDISDQKCYVTCFFQRCVEVLMALVWVLADFNGRPQSTMKPLLVINIVSVFQLLVVPWQEAISVLLMNMDTDVQHASDSICLCPEC